MNLYKINVISVCLLLLVTCGIMLLVPVVDAGTEFRNFRLENDDFWSQEIVSPQENSSLEWKYRLLVELLDGGGLDVYILASKEYERYSEGSDFEAVLSHENINTSVVSHWSVTGDGQVFYLVIDNRNNTHANDAYANETVKLNLSFLKLDEEDDYEGFSSFVCCAILQALAFVALVVIFFIHRSVSGKSSSPKTRYPPCSPPLQPGSSPAEVRSGSFQQRENRRMPTRDLEGAGKRV